MDDGNQTEVKPIRGEGGLFAKGNPGGPGRPAGSRSFTTKVKDALEKIAEGKEYSFEEALIKAILKKAIVDQDVTMMRIVWEQLDGKPIQRMANADGTNLNPVILISEEVAKKYDATRDTENGGQEHGEV